MVSNHKVSVDVLLIIGVVCFIFRFKRANGKKYIPVNADANRTQLNRELIAFPAGVKNRTDAYTYHLSK